MLDGGEGRIGDGWRIEVPATLWSSSRGPCDRTNLAASTCTGYKNSHEFPRVSLFPYCKQISRMPFSFYRRAAVCSYSTVSTFHCSGKLYFPFTAVTFYYCTFHSLSILVLAFYQRNITNTTQMTQLTQLGIPKLTALKVTLLILSVTLLP